MAIYSLYTKDGDPRTNSNASQKKLITVFASNNVLVTKTDS